MSPKEYAQGAMYGKGMYGMYGMYGHYTQWHDMYGHVLATWNVYARIDRARPAPLALPFRSVYRALKRHTRHHPPLRETTLYNVRAIRPRLAR